MSKRHDMLCNALQVMTFNYFPTRRLEDRPFMICHLLRKVKTRIIYSFFTNRSSPLAPKRMIHVAVIGAGAGGLCVGRYIAAQPDVFSAVIYEQTSAVGGTWVYSENTGLDENGLPVHSSMYRNLRTNLPKQVMAFPDFQFPEDVSSYTTHAQVCQYLEDYTDHFSVRNLIQFNTQVVKVSPKVQDDMKEKWEVTVKDMKSKSETTTIFDAVVICNGHYFEPKIPAIPGIEHFPGLVMHSHVYRYPEPFKGKKVVVLGAGASGVDISIDMRDSASTVYLSHNRKPFSCKLPDNLEQHQDIKEVLTDGTVVFQDGQTRQADAIIFCTGYNFSFPFLVDDCDITVKDNRITHLYKHLFNIKYPSMSFIGLGIRICPFPQFSLQARYVLAVLSGSASLPSKKEMFLSEEKEFEEKFSKWNKTHYAHYQGPQQWEYNDELVEFAKCDPLHPVVKNLYEFASIIRANDLLGYKNKNFKVTSKSTWDVI